MSQTIAALLHLLKEADDDTFVEALEKLNAAPLEFISPEDAAQLLGAVEDTQAALEARKQETGGALEQLRQNLSAASAYGQYKAPWAK